MKGQCKLPYNVILFPLDLWQFFTQLQNFCQDFYSEVAKLTFWWWLLIYEPKHPCFDWRRRCWWWEHLQGAHSFASSAANPNHPNAFHSFPSTQYPSLICPMLVCSRRNNYHININNNNNDQMFQLLCCCKPLTNCKACQWPSNGGTKEVIS